MTAIRRILVATEGELHCIDADGGAAHRTTGLEGQRPTGLTADGVARGRAWCCTQGGGVFRSDDGGVGWQWVGLEGERLTTVMASRARPELVWAGTEPSRVWRSDDAGDRWRSTADLGRLPSSSEWAFPPRPDTHHVRWIAPHPADADRLWVAIEAGALISTGDGGGTWSDRVPGGPYDTHELAIHPEAPDVLRAAAGDGYFESRNGGSTWSTPMEGLDVGYLRSIAIDPGDPDVVVVSGASGPRTTYVAGRADGRLYRRVGNGPWQRVTNGWPDPPGTIAPLLLAGGRPGEIWAADERGVHHSSNGGLSWEKVRGFDRAPQHLRGMAHVKYAP